MRDIKKNPVGDIKNKMETERDRAQRKTRRHEWRD